ncbi:MAG TPA: arylesterase [Aestuariivirga sp.]|nr:arylesterase [Aestuariivirga sp.]
MLRISAALVFVFLVVQTALAAPVTILALGDSLTAGLGLEASAAFPTRLEAALKAKGLDVRIVNAGVSGDTAAAGLARLDWALSDAVDGLIVELGANDALRGLDPEQTEAALGAILEKAAARKLPVLIAGMQAPPNLGPDYVAAFDAIYPRLAEKHGAMLYPFFLDGVAAEPSLNQADGIHPNGKGVDIIVERIMPSVEGLIRRAAAN